MALATFYSVFLNIYGICYCRPIIVHLFHAYISLFSVFPPIPPTFQDEYKEAQVQRALVLEKVFSLFLPTFDLIYVHLHHQQRKHLIRIFIDLWCCRATSWVRPNTTTMKTRSGSKYCIVEVCCCASVHFLLWFVFRNAFCVYAYPLDDTWQLLLQHRSCDNNLSSLTCLLYVAVSSIVRIHSFALVALMWFIMQFRFS